MTYTVNPDSYAEPLVLPMTVIFFVGLEQDYSWDEGRLFRHDETGLYAFIAEGGCSCNWYLSHVDETDAETFVRSQDWTPLDHQVSKVLAYVNSDEGYYGNGPAWRAERVAAFQLLLRSERARERAWTTGTALTTRTSCTPSTYLRKRTKKMSEYSTAGMTITQLRRILDHATNKQTGHGLSEDTVIILAKDSEGNGFSPLAGWADDGVYHPESSYAGELHNWDADDVDDDDSSGRYTYEYWRERELADGGMSCLVLWPTN